MVSGPRTAVSTPTGQLVLLFRGAKRQPSPSPRFTRGRSSLSLRVCRGPRSSALPLTGLEYHFPSLRSGLGYHSPRSARGWGIIPLAPLGEVAEWQTRTVQVRVPGRA